MINTSQPTAHTAPATTGTDGRMYPQFQSHGHAYDTLAAVAIRLAQLAHEDTLGGISDGREFERQTILTDLANLARERGAKHPQEAVRMALANIQWVYGHILAPILCVHEEIDIAANNTNYRVSRGEITPMKGDQ